MSEDLPRFDLIETMAFDPSAGLPMLDMHVTRLQTSADVLGFTFDRHKLLNELQAATFSLLEPRRVRVLLSRGGAMAIEVRDHSPWPDDIVPVSIIRISIPRASFAAASVRRAL